MIQWINLQFVCNPEGTLFHRDYLCHVEKKHVAEVRFLPFYFKLNVHLKVLTVPTGSIHLPVIRNPSNSTIFESSGI